jgi:hypothetical protein
MRKLIISSALAVTFVLVGSSGAAQRANEITLAATNSAITFGQTTNLSGKLLLAEPAASQVQILAVPLNDPERQAQVAFTLAADAAGRFGTIVQPTVGTRYAAAYTMPDGSILTSTPITIGVRPKVALTSAGHVGLIFAFKTLVLSGGHPGGQKVNVQRRTPAGWYILKQVRLVSDTRSTTFKVRLPHGASVIRIAMTGVQAGNGYLGGTSPSVRVRTT